MKKLMFVLGLMGIAFFTYAGESKNINIKKMKTDVEQSLNERSVKENDFRVCTVTQTAKVSIYVVDYSVSCSVTAESCDAAINDAIRCVNTAVTKLRNAILQ
jgi:hypothetical protein